MSNNYKIEISYDGTNFYGFQRQTSLRSIQGELEKAVTRLNSQVPIEIQGSGRTDSRVHAIKQVCTFQTTKDINLKYFSYAINRLLPNDIHVHSIVKVSNDFHARYNVVAKLYRYRINIGDYDVFGANYALQLNKKLDINKMIDASKVLIGKIDFRTFTSALERQNTKKTIFSIKITQKNDIIDIEYYGDGFLRYMVRKLTMILIEVGLNNKTKNDIKALLDKKDISAYSKVADGEGLYLVDVIYENKGDM